MHMHRYPAALLLVTIVTGSRSADASPTFPDYSCALLDCETSLESRDWDADLAGSELYLFGDEVVPSSFYSVQTRRDGAGGYECRSPTLFVTTALWGDVVGPGMGPPDDVANVLDIGAMLDKVKGLPTSGIEPRFYLKGGDPEPEPHQAPVNVLDIGFTVDAVKGLPYPFGLGGSCGS